MIWTLRPEMAGMVDRMITTAYQRSNLPASEREVARSASRSSTTATRAPTSARRACAKPESPRTCTHTCRSTGPIPATPTGSGWPSSTPSASRRRTTRSTTSSSCACARLRRRRDPRPHVVPGRVRRPGAHACGARRRRGLPHRHLSDRAAERDADPDHARRQPAAAARTGRAARPPQPGRGGRPRRASTPRSSRPPRRSIAAQVDAGIDIGNDGEQARESFFTYVQHRMTGFGGTSHRPLMRDLLEHPDFLELALPRFGRMKVNLMTAPAAIGEVTYPDTTEVEAECALVPDTPFAETFMTAASPGIVASAMENRYYATRRGVRARGRRRTAHRVPRDRRPRPPAADRRARPRDGTAHAASPTGPLDEFLEWVELVVDASTARSTASIPLGCACTCAGATTRVRTPTTSRSTRSCRSSTARTSARW